MQFTNVTFIGGGRLTYLLLYRLKQINLLPPNCIVIEPDSEAQEKIKRISGNIKIQSHLPDSVTTDILFFSIHPPVLDELLAQFRQKSISTEVIVSFVPSRTIRYMHEFISPDIPIIRAIPNAPSIIGEGYIPYSHSEKASDKVVSNIHAWFRHFGHVEKVEEDLLEGFALISGMGPTYFWFMWEKLRKLANHFYLPESETKEIVYRTVKGALELYHSSFTFEEIQDLIPFHPLKSHYEEIENMMGISLNNLYVKMKKKQK